MVLRWLHFCCWKEKIVLFRAIKWISNRINSIQLMAITNANYTILPILMVNFNIVILCYSIPLISYMFRISFSSGLQATKQRFIAFTCHKSWNGYCNKLQMDQIMNIHIIWWNLICQGLIVNIFSSSKIGFAIFFFNHHD